MRTTLAILLTLAWNRAPDPDVAGYWLYQGPRPGVYTNVLDLGNVGTCMVAGMVVGATNFFAVRGYSRSRGGSELSAEYRWPEEMKAPVLGVKRSDGGVTLTWQSETGAVYRVVGSTDLGWHWFGWYDLTGDLTASGPSMEWTEQTLEPGKFYRVVRVK